MPFRVLASSSSSFATSSVCVFVFYPGVWVEGPSLLFHSFLPSYSCCFLFFLSSFVCSAFCMHWVLLYACGRELKEKKREEKTGGGGGKGRLSQ
mmetsp:Transcript_30359/g.59664  ORF Transcript_30359/g.59664 Transcript_30359/m.59664 type:complete len:94 (+) Transcript_30359:1102-1383(+)